MMLPAGGSRFKVAALPSPSLRSVPRGPPSRAGTAMTSHLPAHKAKNPSALTGDDLEALDPLHTQLDDIAGQGRWTYQLTVTGATFAPLIHVTADWQLLEYRSAGRPLRRVLTSGRAMGAMSSSHPLPACADGRRPCARLHHDHDTHGGRGS